MDTNTQAIIWSGAYERSLSSGDRHEVAIGNADIILNATLNKFHNQ